MQVVSTRLVGEREELGLVGSGAEQGDLQLFILEMNVHRRRSDDFQRLTLGTAGG
jgi:hypothetical protein